MNRADSAMRWRSLRSLIAVAHFSERVFNPPRNTGARSSSCNHSASVMLVTSPFRAGVVAPLELFHLRTEARQFLFRREPRLVLLLSAPLGGAEGGTRRLQLA